MPEILKAASPELITTTRAAEGVHDLDFVSAAGILLAVQ